MREGIREERKEKEMREEDGVEKNRGQEKGKVGDDEKTEGSRRNKDMVREGKMRSERIKEG